MKKQLFLFIALSLFVIKSFAQPLVAAPTPPVRNATDVVSLFSNAYTNVVGTDWFPNWGQSTIVTEILVVGNPTKKYVNLNYQGVQFASAINVSSMTSLHVDIWTPNCTAFDFYLINTSPTLFEKKVTLTPTLSGWNSYDIPLTQYAGVALSNIGQFKFVGAPSGTSQVYLDNIYFWKSSSVPTITGFSIPEKFVGDAPFTITTPTSNSTGAFTYTSSNPSVATISGTTVTVLAAGTSTITATQAAAAPYVAGTATTTLVVSYPPPTTAAPTPPVRNATDYLSLFSDAYTNLAGIDWYPNWGQSTVVSEILVAGNATKKYINLNYQGVQFAAPINVAAMTRLHIDIWTPNCTAFDLYMINTTPSTVEQKVTITPALSGWNSFDIPLTSFPSINLANVGQFKLMGTPAGISTVYLDNIYFWKPSNAPTITGFTVPGKVLGDLPFTLTQPTSNSLGTWTYSSSNLSVATVSGNVVTVVGVGTSIITATQAAWAVYSTGSTTAALVVSYPGPSTAAPTPPLRNTSDYVSIFSDAYTNVAGTDFFPNWGQATIVSDILVAGNPTKKYLNLNYEGTQLAAPINVSTMQFLHIDIWTPNCTAFDLFLINTTPSTVEQKVTLTPTLSGWNSYNIPLTSFNNIALNNVEQLKFEALPSGTTVVYMDNLYFWKASNAPTLTNFNIPPKNFGDAPFTITPPTSNSTGAFTYTSSNPLVATVSGNTITIVGVGSTVITATQAAAGAYTSGSITTTFVVSVAPPPTAAPNPPARNASDVVSLFSDAYSNVDGTIWFPNWGQTTVVSDITIGGNNTKKYQSMNYQGVELASTINVSAMTKMHIDIWTPNCAALDLYLIHITPATVEEKITLTPTFSGWNSFEINMSQFDTVNLAIIAQLKFVALPFGTSNMFVDNIYFYRPGGTVPVSLLDFSANKLGKTSVITWKTATESNNKGFAIERSTNGLSWSQLQFVNGNGNTNSIRSYSITDRNPAQGVNYYRLKQIDLDGRQTLSNIATVSFLQNEIADFSFYPNPVKSTLQISVNNNQSGNAKLELIDMQGRVVLAKTLSCKNGNVSTSLPIHHLTTGVYILKYTDGTVVNTNKVVVN